MAQFLDPFTGMTPDKKLNKRELSRAIRMAVGAEAEAIHQYEAIIDALDPNEYELERKVFQDIADEEKVHIGELNALMKRLEPEEQDFQDEGEKEVEELKREGLLPFAEFIAARFSSES